MRSARSINLANSLRHEHGQALLAVGILLSITSVLTVGNGSLLVPACLALAGATLVYTGIKRL